MENMTHWVRDIYKEFRFRNGVSSFRVFPGCHNMYFFDINNIFRGRFYVKAPVYWSTYEPSRFLFRPIPVVYAYHSNESLQDTQIERYFIWNMVLSKFVIIATMYFLHCARDGIYLIIRALYPRIRSNQEDRLGILTTLTSDLKGKLISFDVFHNVRTTSFAR